MEEVQERALRFLYNDNTSNYSALLEKAGFETLHLKRLKVIAIEVFKCMNNLNPSFMKEIFKRKENMYGLRDEHKLVHPSAITVTYGIKSFSYYGSHIWNLLPTNIKRGTPFRHCVVGYCGEPFSKNLKIN